MSIKLKLYDEALELCERFCLSNRLTPPRFNQSNSTSQYGYFDAPDTVVVNVSRCRAPSWTGYSWSFPRYQADLTPLGVLCHEVGHYIHCCFGWRKWIKEFRSEQLHLIPLTSYEPNTGEAIAESLKVFISNPTLLNCIAPERFDWLSEWLTPVETRHWRELLSDSPRHILATSRKAQRL